MKKLFVLFFAMVLAAPLFAVNVTLNSNAAVCSNIDIHHGLNTYNYIAPYPSPPQITSINQGNTVNINFVGGGATMITIPTCGVLPCGPTNVGTLNCAGTNHTIYVTIDMNGDIIIDII